jgi:hypothetical protein
VWAIIPQNPVGTIICGEKLPAGGIAADEFFEQEAREALRTVAHYGVFFEQVGEDAADAEALQLRKVDAHGLGVVRTIAAGDCAGNGSVVGHHPID